MAAMDWLKGIMGPSAQFPGQPGFGQAPQGSPLGGLAQAAAGALGNPIGNPLGGMMGAPYSPQASDPYGAQAGMGPPMGVSPSPYGGQGGYPTAGDAFASNAGYGSPMGAPGGPPAGPPVGAPMGVGYGAGYGAGYGGQTADPKVAALEAQVLELRHDVEALALFSRTLLTVMLERNILTPEKFQETKNQIDMLDGKLDDRVAK
jgi:hypothetical protein